MIKEITMCDICGNAAIPRGERNTTITVRYEFGLERKGVICESKPLDLCPSCLTNLAALAKGKEGGTNE